MVGTPPCQKRGRCGHWMSAFDKHLRCYDCRKNGKGEESCASGALVEACAACHFLVKVEWDHLKLVFSERTGKRANRSVPPDTPAPYNEVDPEGSEIDSILDLNQDEQPTEARYTTSASLSPLQPGTSVLEIRPLLCLLPAHQGQCLSQLVKP